MYQTRGATAEGSYDNIGRKSRYSQGGKLLRAGPDYFFNPK